MGLEGLLSDLQHYLETLLDRRGNANGHLGSGVPVVGAHGTTALLTDPAGGLMPITSSMTRRPIADAAIVLEPTELAVVVAHRGFVWIEITALDALNAELRTTIHPLLGPGFLHASTIPDRCTLIVQRRTIPGETVADVENEIEQTYPRRPPGRRPEPKRVRPDPCSTGHRCKPTPPRSPPPASPPSCSDQQVKEPTPPRNG